jgi:hypothetical protein
LKLLDHKVQKTWRGIIIIISMISFSHSTITVGSIIYNLNIADQCLSLMWWLNSASLTNLDWLTKFRGLV